MSEDSHGPLRLVLNLKSRKEGLSVSSSDLEKEWNNVDEGIERVEEDFEVSSTSSEAGKPFVESH